MSSAEKLKIELAKVRGEFKMSESDCGSARVQGKGACVILPLHFSIPIDYFISHFLVYNTCVKPLSSHAYLLIDASRLFFIIYFYIFLCDKLQTG